METPIYNSLSKVEYLITFNAFIFGYVVSRFLSGWGKIISRWNKITFSYEHLAWSILGFGLLIDLWWLSWPRLIYIDRTPFSFYISLLSPFIMYLITSLYFPNFADREINNLQKYYSFQRKKGFFYYAIFYGTSLLGAIFVRTTTSADIAFGLIGLGLVLLAFFSKVRWLEQVVIYCAYILLIIHFIIMPSYLSNETWTVKGFSFSEYIVLFITFIYGFIVAQFLDGWAYFVINRKSVKIHFEFVLWSLVLFGLLIDFWYGMWDRNFQISHDFFNFLISLAPAVGFYLISWLIFPEHTLYKGLLLDNLKRNASMIYALIIIIYIFYFLTSQLLILNVLNWI
jgi:hypothetical protein